jgi:excisionase family DNA binding protein
LGEVHTNGVAGTPWSAVVESYFRMLAWERAGAPYKVTPEQASDLLGISRPTVVQRIKRGELKAHMVGAHHRILMSSLIAFRRREIERAAADFEVRSDAVRFAVANNAIEGGQVLPETEAKLDEWARGEIDDDELIEQTLRRFGPGV